MSRLGLHFVGLHQLPDARFSARERCLHWRRAYSILAASFYGRAGVSLRPLSSAELMSSGYSQPVFSFTADTTDAFADATATILRPLGRHLQSQPALILPMPRGATIKEPRRVADRRDADA